MENEILFLYRRCWRHHCRLFIGLYTISSQLECQELVVVNSVLYVELRFEWIWFFKKNFFVFIEIEYSFPDLFLFLFYFISCYPRYICQKTIQRWARQFQMKKLSLLFIFLIFISLLILNARLPICSSDFWATSSRMWNPILSYVVEICVILLIWPIQEVFLLFMHSRSSNTMTWYILGYPLKDEWELYGFSTFLLLF